MDRSSGERLRRLRGDRKIVEVARELGIAPSTLSMYEHDERTPRDQFKVRLAAYYGRSVKYLFFDDFAHNS